MVEIERRVQCHVLVYMGRGWCAIACSGGEEGESVTAATITLRQMTELWIIHLLHIVLYGTSDCV